MSASMKEKQVNEKENRMIFFGGELEFYLWQVL